MSLIKHVYVHDGNGNPIGSLGGALNTHDAHVHNIVLNKTMHQDSAVTTTLTADTATDGTQYTLAIADATGFADGDFIYVNTTSIEPTYAQIVSASPALPTTGAVTLTLDRRLDVQHFIGDTVTKQIINMASQVGTMASPQEYYIQPQTNEVWYLTRLLFEMTSGSAGDLGTFGGISALTNGVTLRVRNNGQYGTYTNWKTNADIKSDMYDVNFDTRAGGGGTYGVTGRGTFTNAGAVVRLDGATNDRLEIYIQDDLTGIDSFTMKFQGHLEG